MSTKSRGVFIAGNWKMNLGPKETASFYQELKTKAPALISPKDLELFNSGKLKAALIPPFLSLAEALRQTQPFPWVVAAQNAHWEKKGAFTGEISGPMLKEIGIDWVLIGHSERRQYFGETDESVRKRSESLLSQGFKLILCIGETREERDLGKTHEVLSRQLSSLCPDPAKGVSTFLGGPVVLAYEPVWAIGTGLTATPEQADEAHEFIRNFLKSHFSADVANRSSILYGGSVTPENVDSLLACPNIDGALVGGASLKPESFLSLISAGARALKI